MPATHTLNTVDGSTVISVTGELDASNAEDMFGWICEAIDAPGCRRVSLDLGGVPFIDSTVIRYLIHANAYAHSSDVPLVVSDAQEFVRRVLWTTGVAGVLGMVSSGRAGR
ncbi:hypothetical protein Cme02nite_47450 [Catellatospora methionotrophica]|uniref:Anti-sigma factor antagonist n=1 Tax=Catellatospora methionotrophica TaxID=121620 RepID=A0A8J3PHG9_9ACTN|nr:STAS domain-containing protein [Catellatospora methionotrophica]GIG16413.1 hypothetical protein Cme02nite_47450 [Catellatospora methionotrophica]